MPKRLSYLTENKVVENGGEVLWSEVTFSSEGGGMVNFRCPFPDCPYPDRKGSSQARRALQQGEKFRALHTKCYNRIRSWSGSDRFVAVTTNLKRTDEILLPKDTVALFHMRAPDDCEKVAIKCRRCFNDKKKNFKYVQYQTIDRYIKGWIGLLAFVLLVEASNGTLWCKVWRYIKLMQFWDEICTDCINKRGSLARHTHDKLSKKSLTVTLFSLEENGLVPIVAELCKCLRWSPREGTVNNWDIYEAICPYHQRRPRELAARLAFLGPPETWIGNEHEEVSAETSSFESLETDSVPPLGNAKKLIDEITPRIVEAKKLAREGVR